MSIQRDFRGNILWIILLNALVKPLYLLGIDRGVQNALPPDEYGLYFTLLNLTFLFQIVADFGLQTWVSKRLATDPDGAGRDYPTFLSFKAILSVAYLLLSLAAAGLFGWLDEHPMALAGILCLQLGNSFLLFLRASVAGMGNYRADSLLSIADRGFSILVMGMFLWLPVLRPWLSIVLFAAVQGLCTALACGLAIWWLRQKGLSFRFHGDSGLWLSLFREGLPYAVMVLLMGLSSRMDTLLIPMLASSGFQASATYAGAFRLLEASNIIGYLFAASLLPLFTRGLNHAGETKRLVGLAIRLLWGMVIPLAIGSSMYASKLISLLYPQAGREMVQTFSLLILSLIPLSGNYVYGTLLTATGSLWPIIRIYLWTSVIQIALILCLFPFASLAGVALASMICHSLAFLLQLRLCIIHGHIEKSGDIFGRVGRYATLIFFSFLAIHFIVSANQLFLLVLGLATASALALWLSGLVDRREWVALLKESLS